MPYAAHMGRHFLMIIGIFYLCEQSLAAFVRIINKLFGKRIADFAPLTVGTHVAEPAREYDVFDRTRTELGGRNFLSGFNPQQTERRRVVPVHLLGAIAYTTLKVGTGRAQLVRA